MAFGMKTTSGDWLPIVKYDARAGKFFKVDKLVGGGNETIEIPMGTKFAIDFGSLEAGHGMIGPQGPVRHMKPYIDGETMPAAPSDKDAEGKPIFKPAFYVKLAGNALDGVREWFSNAATVLNAMDELHTQFIHAPEAAAGQIPIVAIVSTTAVKSGSGAKSSTNYAPVFRVEGWTPRPDILGERTVPVPGANGHAAPAAAPVAAPAIAPVQPAPVTPPPVQHVAAAAPAAGMPF